MYEARAIRDPGLLTALGPKPTDPEALSVSSHMALAADPYPLHSQWGTCSRTHNIPTPGGELRRRVIPNPVQAPPARQQPPMAVLRALRHIRINLLVEAEFQSLVRRAPSPRRAQTLVAVTTLACRMGNRHIPDRTVSLRALAVRAVPTDSMLSLSNSRGIREGLVKGDGHQLATRGRLRWLLSGE